MKVSYMGLIASLGCILLCCILLFWNPYSGVRAGNDTVFVIFLMLILPACLGIITSFIRYKIMMFIVFVWSLPYGLYLSIAKIPSIFNLFGIVLVLYLVSAILMKGCGEFGIRGE